MTKDRQRNSIEVFNEYVNELISEYQTTGKVNYEELARKHIDETFTDMIKIL